MAVRQNKLEFQFVPGTKLISQYRVQPEDMCKDIIQVCATPQTSRDYLLEINIVRCYKVDEFCLQVKATFFVLLRQLYPFDLQHPLKMSRMKNGLEAICREMDEFIGNFVRHFQIIGAPCKREDSQAQTQHWMEVLGNALMDRYHESEKSKTLSSTAGASV